jgi:predicted O-methyltransferase YrrM
MLHKLYILRQFLYFYWRATTRHGVHSPFVFDFTESIIEDDRAYYSFFDIEYLRYLLQRDKRKINVTDFGAGSKQRSGRERSVKSIAKTALTGSYFCEILFKIVHHYQLKNRLELGTSLGLSTLYIAKPLENQGVVVSLEGCPNIAAVATENFNRLNAKNIEVVVGNIDETLDSALKKAETWDFIFLDGNHRKEPTIQYFEQCLPYLHNDSIVLFDDIYWSPEMTEAWEIVKNHPNVTTTIDLFAFGIVFFRKEFKEKQHFKLLPDWMKFGQWLRF